MALEQKSEALKVAELMNSHRRSKMRKDRRRAIKTISAVTGGIVAQGPPLFATLLKTGRRILNWIHPPCMIGSSESWEH
jgi:hypothetical protein